MKRTISVFAVSALAWASAAFAGPPERVKFGPEDILGAPFGQCAAGFEILIDLKYYGEYFVFFDSDGYPDRIFYKQRYPYVLYNATDPSKRIASIPSDGDQRWLDVEDGEIVTLLGAFHDLVTIPGYGVVLLSPGRLVVDLRTFEVLFEAKGFTLDEEALCAYLAN